MFVGIQLLGGCVEMAGKSVSLLFSKLKEEREKWILLLGLVICLWAA